jgi:hypothetical protein
MKGPSPVSYSVADTERLTTILSRIAPVPLPPRVSRARPANPQLTVDELEALRWEISSDCILLTKDHDGAAAKDTACLSS